MKTFLSLLLITFIINTSFASRLQLSFAQYGKYIVKIDDVVYKTQGNSIEVRKLKQGNHHLRIVKKTRNSYNNSISRQVIYNSSINLPAKSTIQASIFRPYQLQINNVISHQQQNNQVTYSNQTYNNNSYHQTNNNTSYNNNNYHNSNHHSCNSTNHKNGFSHKEFQRLLYRIDNQPNPRFKKQTVINAINRHGIYTHQLTILLNRFRSDMVKLDIAKSSYYHTIDFQNYEVLNNSFYYQSSVNELTCFVHQH